MHPLFKFQGTCAGVLAVLYLSGLAPVGAQVQEGPPAPSYPQGAAKLSPDGRFAYFGTREGWLTRYDLSALSVTARVPTGTNIRSLALSGDGRWILVAGTQPEALTLFDANLQVVRTYALAPRNGKTTTRVAGVFEATPRQSFIVALQDIAELWEISYDPKAEPIHEGLVHDYRMGEAIAAPGFLGVRRTPLDEPLDVFFLDGPRRHVLGATRPEGAKAANVQVINLDVRRQIAAFPLPGAPAFGSSLPISRNGTDLLAIPHAQDGCVTLVDVKTWRVVRLAIALEPPPSGDICHETPQATEPRSLPDAVRR